MTEPPRPMQQDNKGPRFRPRRAALRVLVGCLLLYPALLLWLVAALFEPLRGGAGLFVLYPMLGLILLAVLVLGAQIHAYAGGPRELGAVASLWQLWRQPHLRGIPTLPNLPGWRVALGYLVPLLIFGSFLVWGAPYLREGFRVERKGDQFWANVARRDMERRALEHGFLRITCQEFPVPIHERSLCFVFQPGQALAGRTDLNLGQAINQWVERNNSWLEWSLDDLHRGESPVRHGASPFQISIASGGGFQGGQQTVTLPRVAKAGHEPVWGRYRLEALSRQPSAGRVPVLLESQAAWLLKQPFTAYFVVTPLD